MEVDFSITQPEDLIGKDWTCPMCKEKKLITMTGVEHTHKRHWWKLNLQALFDMHIAKQNYERQIHEIMFRE